MNFTADGRVESGNRAIGIGFVVLFHILLVWGLANGLARKAVELLPAPIETKIIEDIQPPAEEAPPPKPEFEPPPPPYVPPPDIVIAAPVQATTAITQTTSVKAPPAPKKTVRIPPRIDLKGSPRACKEPEYPAASERLGESGTSAISLLVGADGKVTQSRVDASSGHKRLDEAAIKAFSRCKFFVGTTDGVAEASWFSIKYKWVVPK